MTDEGQRFKRLTEAEALRALYMDFEGEKGKPPILLGVHRRGHGARPFVHQDTLDETFASLGGSTMTLRAAVTKVVQRAECRDCRIVAWSEHELRIVGTLDTDDPELVARFKTRFANARAVAKHWRNKLYAGKKPAAGRLVDYLALIEYGVPAEATGGDVGDTIRAIRSRLERGLSPTVVQRERWERLVEHNRFDCAGMRRVCLRAMRELDAAG
jgi:hypothetical protein